MVAIDTNLVVRYLTNDHPEQSPRARALIDGTAVFVPVTVVLEADWVLRSAYGADPAEVIAALRAFGGLPTVTIEDAGAVADALDLAARGADLADALHLSRAGHCEGFATFDRRFVKDGAQSRSSDRARGSDRPSQHRAATGLHGTAARSDGAGPSVCVSATRVISAAGAPPGAA